MRGWKIKSKKFYPNKKRIKLELFISILLIVTFLSYNINAENSQVFDFSISVENNELIFESGETITTQVSVNLISGTSDNVTLEGEWTGEQQPENISVELTKTYGIPSFSCNITFTSIIYQKIGIFNYTLKVKSENKNHSINIKINVSNTLNVTLTTDKEQYEKNQTITISGNITTLQETNLSGNVTLNIQKENWKRTKTIQFENSLYEYDYRITYGDPEGTWKITATITDVDGSTGSCSKNINVTLTEDTIRYKAVWYAPEGYYYRGDTIDISVYVTEAGDGLEDATTSCMLPSIKKINLTEKEPGYYHTTYTIPLDGETGRWS